MGPEQIADLFREAIYIVVIIVAVVIIPSLIVGLVVSTFQAATQINEQTLSFLPRLIITLLCCVWFGPWIVSTVIDYTEDLYRTIPLLIG